METTPQTPAAEHMGIRRLGKYELIAKIGTGGMAEVYLARQRGPMDFEKVVVVKSIHPHLSSQQYHIHMLLDEARIAARLKHPNVVDIYDLGVDGDRYFIAMEYLAGQPMLDLLRTGRSKRSLSISSTVRIIADVAEGLHAAHELEDREGQPLELVHRDVSPGNIIVLHTGQVKIVDFGIAKARGRLSETEARSVKGKLGYVSPEQVSDDPIDRRSDIFSLGVVLWESLALRRLFRASTMAATVQAVLQRPIPPPSRYRKEVPPALDAACLRALQRKPSQRFATAFEMQQALEKVLAEIGDRDERRVTARYMEEMFGGQHRAREELLRKVAVATSEIEIEAESADEFELPAASGEHVARPGSVPPERAQSVPGRAQSVPPERAQSVPPERAQSVPPERAQSVPPERAQSVPPEQTPLAVEQANLAATVAAQPRVGRRTVLAVGGGLLLLFVIVAIAMSSGSGGPDGEFASKPFDDSVQAITRNVEAVAYEGAANEGAADEGAAYEGAADEGAADEGAADEGAADEGAADEGAADEGAADEGAADEGAANEGAANEGAANEGAANEGAANEGASEGADEAAATPGNAEGGEASAAFSLTLSGDPATAGGADGEPAATAAAKPRASPRSSRDRPPRAESATSTPLGPDGEPLPRAKASALYTEGIQLFVQGKTSAAKSKFRSALRVQPDYAQAHRGLGMVYQRQGQKAKAVRAFKTYLKLSPRARDRREIKRRIAAMGG